MLSTILHDTIVTVNVRTRLISMLWTDTNLGQSSILDLHLITNKSWTNYYKLQRGKVEVSLLNIYVTEGSGSS